MDDDSRRRRPPHPPLASGCGEDRISCLPDELLHAILVGLGSFRAAARTSVLSRRWRRVWAHLPKILLSDPRLPDPPPASSFPDTVDAALASYAASTLEHLSISERKHGPGPGVPAHRIAPWLRFASQRVTGELFLSLRPDLASFQADEAEEELELPACGAATNIILNLEGSSRLRPAAGMFVALTELKIEFAHMEGRELSDLVSTQCPRLEKLRLFVTLVAVADVTIHSDTLHSVLFAVLNTRRLEVVAPGLEELALWTHSVGEAHITAPKLAMMIWHGAYDPFRHHLIHFACRLRLLRIKLQTKTTLLMKQFDEVDKLSLDIDIPEGIGGYKSFMNETSKISKCETLDISLAWGEHDLAPSILRIFRCCNNIRKLRTVLISTNPFGPSLRYSCPSACPCHLAESYKIDDIALSSLEEVELSSFEGSHEEMEFVELLSRCNAAVLKKLVIFFAENRTPSLTMSVCEKVRSMCRPNLEVEFYVNSDRKWVRFD